MFTLRSKPASPRNTAERDITGRVEEITKTFANNDGTTAIIARLSDGRVIRGTVDDVEEIEEGGFYYFAGRWDEHNRYGWQFHFQSHVVDIPRDESGSAAYLMRHCTGIGMVTAKKLVEQYGDQAVLIVIDEPHRTVEDGILRDDVATAASKSLKGVCDPALRNAHQELSRFFHGGGFPRKLIGRCLKEFGKEAPVRIQRDPFVLLTKRMPGCGFLRTDKLYMKLGHSPHRLKRQALAAVHDLKSKDGDTWMSLAKGFNDIRTRIGGTTARPQRAIALAYRAGLVAFHMDTDGNCWLADKTRATNEKKLAHHVQILRNVDRVCWPTTGLIGLSEHQQAEILKALSSPIGILTGGPGTGKTFTAAALVKALSDSGCMKEIAVCAPTGKAAVRVGQKLHDAGLAKLTPTTIHKLLGVVPSPDGGWEFSFNEKNPLPFRFVIVDEASMLDTDLAASLVRACAPATHLLIVGDANQLPPVGHGAPLRDLLDAGVPAARLTEIRRNSGAIVEACVQVREGDTHFHRKENLSDFTITDNLIQLKARGVDKMIERVHQVYEWLAVQGKWDLIEDVQVLSARNETRKKLNKELQKLLNPKGEGNHKVFRTGDKIINLRNNLFSDIFVANGDIGRVNSFRERQMIVGLTAPVRHVVVPLGRVAEEDDDRGGGEEDDTPNTGCSWDLAYCCTCHKYQGSETPVTIILAEPAGPLASREWLYTAISRARELCIMIGGDADIGRYVKNTILPNRKTLLVEWMKEGLS